MNLDSCSLLRNVEQLRAEVSAMKKVLQLQAETSKGLLRWTWLLAALMAQRWGLVPLHRDLNSVEVSYEHCHR